MSRPTPQDWAEGPHSVRFCSGLTAEEIRCRTTEVWSRVCVALDQLGLTEDALFVTSDIRWRIVEDMLFATEEMLRRADQEGVPHHPLGEGDDPDSTYDALEEWIDNWSRCSSYDRATMSRTAAFGAGVEGGENLWDAHAFITRWGTSERLGAEELDLVDRWWWWANRLITPADIEAMAGLARAIERIGELHRAAGHAEATLRDHGYEAHPDSGLLVEVKSGKRGRRRTLLAEWAVRVFEYLVENEGLPRRNTAAVRRAVCESLADKFHPDLLDAGKDGKVYNALDAHLNPQRDHRNRGKRALSKQKRPHTKGT